MVDPTSDLGEDVDEDDAPTCETCGKKLVTEPEHRVVSWVEDGSVQHRHFCSDECEASWQESNDAR
jgi:hypothetical protein